MQLRFSSEAVRLLVREHRLDSQGRLRVLIYNFMRKPGGKNVNETPNRGQQVSSDSIISGVAPLIGK